MKQVLFIGALHTKHTLRLVKRIADTCSDDMIVHVLDTGLDRPGDIIEDGDHLVIHSLKQEGINNRLYHLPKVGVLFRIIVEGKLLKELLKQNHFSVVAVISVPMEAPLFVRLAHRYNSKTVLVALGSDILRVSKFKARLQRRAFKETDFVSADKELRFSRDMMKAYNIPETKCRALGFGSDAMSLLFELRGKQSKLIMQESLGLPPSKYNIVCGYNAFLSQRHEEMIRALISNLDVLPEGYLIIIPLTYGLNKEEIILRLKAIPGIEKLNIAYLTDYLSPECVANLRMITDLFIHIQTTDGYNASLQEFMIAGAQCVNGAWLKYDTLEKYGKPYHTIDKVDDLAIFLHEWFTGKIDPVLLPTECEREIRNGKDWGIILPIWKRFLEAC